LNVTLEVPLEQIEGQLQEEQANLAAMDTRRADFERRLTDERDRPAVIRQLLADGAEISDDTHQLIRMATIFAALVGLYMIWSPLLPAMRIFDDINLWHYTVTVDGVEKSLPITLADLGLALMILLGMGVLAKRLPAVLEMILLQRFDMSAGSRYTVQTLTNYVIVAE